jgi:hypothetical protein
METGLSVALAERFAAVNGRHPMTPADDEYVSEWYSTLEDVAAAEGITDDELAKLILAGALPLPSYVRSDGVFMVPRDLLALARHAGGVSELPDWFGRQFSDPGAAVAAWHGYANGHWVCLREVTPAGMKRKDELVDGISRCLAEAERGESWRSRVADLVDELDELEPPFTPYDRLRFGGPVSRDRFITDVRLKFLSHQTTS